MVNAWQPNKTSLSCGLGLTRINFLVSEVELQAGSFPLKWDSGLPPDWGITILCLLRTRWGRKEGSLTEEGSWKRPFLLEWGYVGCPLAVEKGRGSHPLQQPRVLKKSGFSLSNQRRREAPSTCLGSRLSPGNGHRVLFEGSLSYFLLLLRLARHPGCELPRYE